MLWERIRLNLWEEIPQGCVLGLPSFILQLPLRPLRVARPLSSSLSTPLIKVWGDQGDDCWPEEEERPEHPITHHQGEGGEGASLKTPQHPHQSGSHLDPQQVPDPQEGSAEPLQPEDVQLFGELNHLNHRLSSHMSWAAWALSSAVPTWPQCPQHDLGGPRIYLRVLNVASVSLAWLQDPQHDISVPDVTSFLVFLLNVCFQEGY